MTEKSTFIYNFLAPQEMAHPTLDQPKKFKRKGKEVGEPKYSASYVLANDSEDLKGLKATALAAAASKWPGRNIVEDFKAGKFKLPFSSGDKLADAYVEKRKKDGKADDGRADFQRGKTVLKTSSIYPPALSGFVNGKVVDFDRESELYKSTGKKMFYFGVQALAQVNFVPYDGVDGGIDGVTAYLGMVLSTNKGERRTGGQSAAEAFSGFVGHSTVEDPTAGEQVNDDIAF